ncbi:hypothetical protein LEP1GSC195_0300 [Leptospira wolbachii serovar Codice str. CDC]|uniref:Uncharacterized protein n=1 Tax=Leptospira wolbachii serovar Codice str. CDC TaxID=1218599 RepID=R9A4C7_9LEPT|nr:hypothetical protein LEP1GSC195_0300 [Leptospira wolbachii serovar Codice str. CDC]
MTYENLDSLKKEFPNWNFVCEEISNNIYSMKAKNNYGHKVSYKGTEYNAILQKCAEHIRTFEMNLPNLSK